MRLTVFACILLASGTALAADETPAPLAAAPRESASLGADCVGKLKLGKVEFAMPEGLQTIRLPLTCLDNEPVNFLIRTRFIQADDETSTPQKGGFETISRGFVGLISLGASEAALQREVSSDEAVIATRHRLEPGESIVVEHQLPYTTPGLLGSVSRVSLETPETTSPRESRIRQSFSEEYWDRRERYFQARRVENARWEALRSNLARLRQNFEPLSEGYREAMKGYWAAHRAHRLRLQTIEDDFQSFAEAHRAELEAQLLKN